MSLSKEQTINGAFTLQLPDTFEFMSDKELGELSRGGGDPYQWGVRDKERHVVILALWKRYPSLLARMSDLKAIAKKNERQTRKVYEGYDYRSLGLTSLQTGEINAEGYSFSYRLKDITQVVQCFLIKDNSIVYSIACVGREENIDADREMFQEIIKSLHGLERA